MTGNPNFLSRELGRFRLEYLWVLLRATVDARLDGIPQTARLRVPSCRDSALPLAEQIVPGG